jgi:hypothetical protein
MMTADSALTMLISLGYTKLQVNLHSSINQIWSSQGKNGTMSIIQNNAAETEADQLN